MAHRVTLIPGDGTGYELTEAARRVWEATGVAFDWDVQQAGADVCDEYNTPLPDHVLESIKRNKVALKGPITTPVGKGFRSVNVSLRKQLEMYVCLRPCKTYPGVRTRFDNIDLVIVRENTEDLYAGIEFEQGKPETAELINHLNKQGQGIIKADSGVSIKPISMSGSRRIFEYAFDYARKNNRKKVTAVHKANIMKFSDGLFLKVGQEVAAENKDIPFDHVLVDNLCMQLVQNPEQYDTLVLPNLYGDIVSDLAAGLVGGLGMAPGANIGTDCAVFEATHGSAPLLKGLNKANPLALILSGMMMLHHLGETNAAERLDQAIKELIKEGTDVTFDMKDDPNDPSAVGTKEMADALIRKLQA